MTRKGFLIVGLGILGVRVVVAVHAPLGIYHGFNEAFYMEVAREAASTGTPSWLGHPFYDTPPLLTIGMSFWGMLLGWSPGVMRLESILAYAGVACLSYLIGNRLRGDGPFRVFLVAATPWVAYWMTKAQTDPLLTLWVSALVYLSLLGTTTAAWMVGPVVFLGLMSKQTMVLTLPIIVLWPTLYRARAAWAALGGLMANLAWWGLQYRLHPSEVLGAWRFHATGRASPFGDWVEVLGVGILFGSAGLALALKPSQKLNQPELRPILYSCLAFLGFALIDAPINHAYYTLPGIYLLTVIAPGWRSWPRHAKIAYPALAITGTCLMLVLGGEIGPNVLQQALDATPKGTPVQSKIWPQTHWLGWNPPSMVNGCPKTNLSLCNAPQPGCTTIQTFGWLWRDLFLVTCPSRPKASPSS